MGKEKKFIIDGIKKEYLSDSLSNNIIYGPEEALEYGMIEMKPAKSIAHSLRIPFLEFNRKFVSQDGLKEVVFDYKTGELITDSINRGTDNKYSPYTNPILHLRYDYFDYLINGTSLNDPTTILERTAQVYKLTAIPIVDVKNNLNNTVIQINTFNDINFILSLNNYFNH